MKEKILYFTDCYIFGGAEMVLVNLINDPIINEKFEVVYSYRYNKKFQEGVGRNFGPRSIKYALPLLSNDSIAYDHMLSKRKGLLKYWEGIILLCLRTAGFYFLYNLLTLYAFFKKINPAILHINNGGYPGARTCLTAVLSARLAKINRIIFHVNNIALKQKNVMEKWIDKYIKWNVEVFITASKHSRLSLTNNREFDENRVIQIYNAVKQPEVSKSRTELLNYFNIDEHKFIIVEVALLTGRKGQIFLLKALKTIRETDPQIFKEIIVILVGDGEDRPKLEKYALDNSLEKKVIFAGFQTDYLNYINAADIFVLPSKDFEDMPLVILSAMFLKKGIISTDFGGIAEEIQNNVSGILLPPKELNKLPEKIVELYNDQEGRKTLGENAFSRYVYLFSYEKIMATYSKLYERLIGRKSN